MISADVAKRIREIEIYTKRMVSGSLIGDTTSAYKGSGLDFDQLREYQQGDDVRFIDWHSSARADKLLVRQYIEERNRTIILAVDCSASTFFGSQQRLKYDYMAEIAAILALVGNYGKDKVGLLLFSDDIELYIPPRRNRTHTHLILEKLFSHKPQSSKTNITKALEYLVQLKKSPALVFVVSDFIDVGMEHALGLAARMYDMVALCIRDVYEYQLPAIGRLTMRDSEHGLEYMVDLGKKSSQKINGFLKQHNDQWAATCSRYGVESVSLTPEACAIGSLVRLFRRRMRY